MPIDCRVFIDGARFPDSVAQLEAATPTALADLQLIWGRGTTVDQPDAATCRVTVLDRSGGVTFLEQIPVGVPFDVWASGDISTGQPVETMVDGGFETLPVGPADARVRANLGDAVAVAAPVHAGVRAVAVVDEGYGQVSLSIPPAPWSTDPAAWDQIPQALPGAVWTISLWAKAPPGVNIGVSVIKYADPNGTSQSAQFVPGVVATGSWQQITRTVTITAFAPRMWAGIAIGAPAPKWEQMATTWADTPLTWADWGQLVVDDVSLLAPPSGTDREALVFSGRVTDLTATIDDPDGTLRVDVTATDQLADLQNRYVGDVPWPKEAFSVRVAKILTAAAVPGGVDTRIDNPLSTLQVSWRDVDNQPAGGLLSELTAGVDGVLWSATHATTGPYLWFENPALRAQTGRLTLSGATVVIVVDDPGGRAPGRTTLDGCTLPDDPVTWRRDVTDVITRVDATWQEQTVDDEGNPQPTERTVQAVDGAAESEHGARRMGVSTPLTTAPDATNVANRVLARTRELQWRVEGLEYDLGLFPPAPGLATANALDLLDGTTRLGRGLIVDDVERWPGGDTAGLYLDGGQYSYDGAWRLAMVCTPNTGMGASARWNQMDRAWRWNQMDRGIEWNELWGVTGPITELEAA